MTANTDLTGKVAIITGAAQGMGAATAKLFVESGAKVVIADVQDEAGQTLANELGESALFVHLDVSNETQWATAVKSAEEKFGHVTVLVNNAGIIMFKSMTETTRDDYMKLIEINQLGVFLGMQAVIESMKVAGAGSIINISSIDGLQSKNSLIAYSSSKWAIRGLTKSAAIELGPYKIRVNSVHPGGVDTNMGDGSEAGMETEDAGNVFYKNQALHRVAAPIEIARMSAFLASDLASYSTGAEFTQYCQTRTDDCPIMLLTSEPNETLMKNATLPIHELI